MKSGETLWNALDHKYYAGVDSVRWMERMWNTLETRIDPYRFSQVKMLLNSQERQAVPWRHSCVMHVQTLSRRPIPEGLEKPEHSLDYYMKLSFPYAPGIRPRW